MFKIPIAKAEASTTSPGIASKANSPDPSDLLPLFGARILIVDDCPDNLELVQIFLEKAGAEVITANSAAEALLLLEKVKPDVLITDIEMPQGNGYDLLKQIQSLRNLRQLFFPVLAFTAHSSQEENQKLRNAGFDAKLTKPFSREELVHSVAAALKRTG